jgi:glycosyltransferase involved in cell wall biosynthesis
MTTNVTLIIPTYRNPTCLDLCLRSATENLVDSNNHILVIVDGYFDESRTALAKYPNVRYLELEHNQGMQAAINLGVMQAETEYVFVINDDNVMPAEWDTRLVTEINRMSIHSDERGRGRWCLTVDQVEPTGPSMFEFTIHDLGHTTETFQYDEWLRYERHIAEGSGHTDDTGHIFPFVIAKRYYLAVGGLDTFYGSPNVCDWDFFLKLELLGFAFPRTRALRLYHFGSVATKKNAESATFKAREANAFAEYQFKWGVPPHNVPRTNSKLPPTKLFRGFSV